MAKFNYWKTREHLIDDINNNNIFVNMNTKDRIKSRKITDACILTDCLLFNRSFFDEKCGTDPQKSYCSMCCLICKYKYIDEYIKCNILNMPSKEHINRFNHCIRYTGCCYSKFKNKEFFCVCSLNRTNDPCTIMLSAPFIVSSWVIYFSSLVIIAGIETVLSPCTLCLCLLCKDDLRYQTIKGTYPVEIKKYMDYSHSECSSIVPPSEVSFITKFNAPFGQVELLYDKDYSEENKHKEAFVEKLFIDGIEEKLLPISSRRPCAKYIAAPSAPDQMEMK